MSVHFYPCRQCRLRLPWLKEVIQVPRIGFYSMLGLQAVILVNVLLVKRMLKNHHDQSGEHRDDEPRDSL